MFEIIQTRTGQVIDIAEGVRAAQRRADFLTSSTMRLHTIRARASVSAPTALARAYRAGTVEWIDDIPTAIA